MIPIRACVGLRILDKRKTKCRRVKRRWLFHCPKVLKNAPCAVKAVDALGIVDEVFLGGRHSARSNVFLDKVIDSRTKSSFEVLFDRLALKKQARTGTKPSTPDRTTCCALFRSPVWWRGRSRRWSGARGADLEPVLGATGQAGDGAARGFADVALGPGSAGREGLLGDVGLDAAPEGVPGEVHGAFEVAAGGDEVGGLRELADGGAGRLQFPAAALCRGRNEVCSLPPGEHTVKRKKNGEDRVATYAAAGKLPAIVEAFEKAKKASSKAEIMKLISFEVLGQSSSTKPPGLSVATFTAISAPSRCGLEREFLGVFEHGHRLFARDVWKTVEVLVQIEAAFEIGE